MNKNTNINMTKHITWTYVNDKIANMKKNKKNNNMTLTIIILILI